MKAYKGTFTANVGTGAQVVNGIVDEGGNAFTPTALFLWTSYATANNTFEDGYGVGLGVTDGTTDLAQFGAGDDNVATSQGASALSSSVVAVVCAATAVTVTRAASLTSFGSGEFTINWGTADGAAPIYHYLALGGTDLDVEAAALSPSRRSPVNVGLRPRAILAPLGISSSGQGSHMMGWVVYDDDGTISQGTSGAHIEDAQATSDTRRIQRNDALFLPWANNGAISGTGTQDSFGTGWQTAEASNSYTSNCLFMAGIGAAAGSFMTPTSTGNNAVTGLGFSPKCVLIMTIGNATITNTAAADHARFSLGGFDRTRQGVAYDGSNDAVTPTESVKRSDTSTVLLCAVPNATAASTTKEIEASLTSVDADGFTLNFTTVDATQRQVLWFALGDEPSAGGGGAHAATFFGV